MEVSQVTMGSQMASPLALRSPLVCRIHTQYVIFQPLGTVPRQPPLGYRAGVSWNNSGVGAFRCHKAKTLITSAACNRLLAQTACRASPNKMQSSTTTMLVVDEISLIRDTPTRAATQWLLSLGHRHSLDQVGQFWHRTLWVCVH